MPHIVGRYHMTSIHYWWAENVAWETTFCSVRFSERLYLYILCEKFILNNIIRDNAFLNMLNF